MSSSKRPAMGRGLSALLKSEPNNVQEELSSPVIISETFELEICLLYTSDAADE